MMSKKRLKGCGREGGGGKGKTERVREREREKERKKGMGDWEKMETFRKVLKRLKIDVVGQWMRHLEDRIWI
jgi:hypothetical protein